MAYIEPERVRETMATTMPSTRMASMISSRVNPAFAGRLFIISVAPGNSMAPIKL